VERRRGHAVRELGPEGAPPIVFAHGFGCSQDMWRLVAPAFAGEHRVVVFDHVGAGEADPALWDPERHGSLDGYADDVIALLDELALGPVTFVGHSVSSMIGVLACTRRRDLIDRLVLVSPSPRYLDDDGYRGGFTRADMEDLLAQLDRNYIGWAGAMAPAIMGNPDRPELAAELESSFCRTDPDIARHFARATFLGDNRSDLRDVSVPTLVLQCADDAIAPTEVGSFVAEQIPNAALHVLPVSGHCPNLSAPELTADAIRAFVTAA